MIISRLELEEDPKLGPKLKAWAHQLNTAAKAAGAPTFKVNGPQRLNVRYRKYGRPSGPYDFMGGEEWRVSSIVLDREISTDTIKMLAILNPVDLEVAKEIASVTLPLADALEAFDGLEAWLDLTALESEARAKAIAAAAPPVIHVPTVEESRASEVWGKW